MSNNTLKKRIDEDGNRIIEVYEGDLNEMRHQIDKLTFMAENGLGFEDLKNDITIQNCT